MASYDSDRPNVATGSGSVPTKKKSKTKPVTKKPAAAKPAGSYDWGDGRAVHSIPLEQHNANRGGVATYGLTPNQPLDAPLTAGQAYAMAQAAANRTYAPQLAANAQLQSNTPAWYQNYITRTGEAQKAAQTYAQPTLDTAQAAVGNAAQTAPGLDPSSPQYAAEQQAAKGRGTMAQDSANYLAGVAAATNAYFGGQANIAQRELPQVQAGLVYQGGQLASQRQDAATAEYGTIRTNEQNAGIARETLGLNTAKAKADVDLGRGVDPVTGKPLPAEPAKGYAPGGPGLNKYGFTYDQWSGMSPAAQAKERNKGTTAAGAKDAEKKAADEKKRIEKVRTATGNIRTRIKDAQTAWERYGKIRNPKTHLDPVTGDDIPDVDPKTKKPVLVGASADQLKAKLRKDGFTETEIHVMLMLRGKKKLTQAEVDSLKRQDKNIRIPRAWLPGKASKNAAHPDRPAAPKNDKSGYGDYPH